MTCAKYDSYQGRICRNKAVTAFPRKGFKTKDDIPLCRKHARQQADHILERNKELVWALKWKIGWVE